MFGTSDKTQVVYMKVKQNKVLDQIIHCIIKECVDGKIIGKG